MSTPADVAAPYRLAFAPDAAALYWVDNIAVFSWQKPLTERVVDGLTERGVLRIQEYPRGLSVVHIGNIELFKVDGPTRQALVRSTQAVGKVAAVALVMPASGFWASAVQSVATAILTLARTSTALRFHDDVDDVLAWLPQANQRATGVTVDIAKLRRTLHDAARNAQRVSTP